MPFQQPSFWFNRRQNTSNTDGGYNVSETGNFFQEPKTNAVATVQVQHLEKVRKRVTISGLS